MGSAKKASVAGNKATTPAYTQATTSTTANGGTKGTWHGYSVCGLLRALGNAGYTAKQATQLLPLVGLPTTSASTVGCQVGAGRQVANGVPKPHHPGAVVPLTGAALAEVVAACGQPANPVQAKPAPAPVPAVAPAKPRKGGKAAQTPAPQG